MLNMNCIAFQSHRFQTGLFILMTCVQQYFIVMERRRMNYKLCSSDVGLAATHSLVVLPILSSRAKEVHWFLLTVLGRQMETEVGKSLGLTFGDKAKGTVKPLPLLISLIQNLSRTLAPG